MSENKEDANIIEEFKNWLHEPRKSNEERQKFLSDLQEIFGKFGFVGAKFRRNGIWEIRLSNVILKVEEDARKGA